MQNWNICVRLLPCCARAIAASIRRYERLTSATITFLWSERIPTGSYKTTGRYAQPEGSAAYDR
jgi:hypothetical protein